MKGFKLDTSQLQRSKAPDGGWGWMIVFAYGLANIMIVPVLQSFGLIFRDTFREIDISATKASIIINLASAVGMALGLFNGPLLRRYGFRKLAVAGGFLFSAGLMLTSSAVHFAHFIITYSIIASLGMGFCNSSFSLALNTYFVVRRNKAAGIAMTITGLGPILLPQLVSLLLGLYGARYCLLIIGALATHIIVGGLLLQPVKWHMLTCPPSSDPLNTAAVLPCPPVEVKIVPATEDCTDKGTEEAQEEDELLEKCSFIDHDVDAQSVYGFELTSQLRQRESFSQPPGGFMSNVPGMHTIQRTKSEVLAPVRRCSSETRSLKAEPTSAATRPLRWFQSGSEESVHLGSSLAMWGDGNSSVTLTDDRVVQTEEQQQRRPSQGRFSSYTNVRFSPLQKRWFEGSAQSVNLGSSMKLFDERSVGPRRGSLGSGVPMSGGGKLPALSENQGLTDETSHLPSIVRQLENTKATLPQSSTVPNEATAGVKPEGFFTKVVHMFDLTLLQDKVYLNMMLGMSIAVFAEINFSLLTPFILGDLGYSTEQIASIMSTLALADLLFRFISPFVGDFLKLSPRIMYMIALSMLIVTRFSILLARSYDEMMIVAFGLGVAKGVRSVYMSLVIPSYIPLKRLPSASSIQMTTNGIVLMTIGPCVGVLRDWTGSYSKSIILINGFTIVTLVMWSAELIYVHRRQNRAKQKVPPNSDAVPQSPTHRGGRSHCLPVHSPMHTQDGMKVPLGEENRSNRHMPLLKQKLLHGLWYVT
uniref:Major facilitator superfamily (MFS) profile domain-containing protein n=1 Tax=Anopheles culicifacies TaxID=139723 RepID=A0A182LVG8_9DIPT